MMGKILPRPVPVAAGFMTKGWDFQTKGEVYKRLFRLARRGNPPRQSLALAMTSILESACHSLLFDEIADRNFSTRG